MPRIIVAILENHQQADGSVRIPVALQPFLGGQTHLLPAS
jgi:seryl-tRNA synthetase